MIKLGVYYQFREELLCSDVFKEYSLNQENGNVLHFLETHKKNDLLMNTNSPWINYEYFFPSWSISKYGRDFWPNVLTKIGYI